MSDFHFLRPGWLAAAIPLAVVLWLTYRSRPGAGAWRRACDAHLLPHLLVALSRGRRAWLSLLALGWIIAVIALAGPAWTELELPVFKRKAARVLLMDLSHSMDATDLSPSRLARARFKALDILARSREGQSALVVFAQDAYVVSPLTDDANTIAALVPVLETGLMPAQGSRLGGALIKADELLEQAGEPGGEVLVIADGLSDLPAALEAVDRLARNGRRVSVLGAGTPDGAPIPLARGGFLKDAEGAIVVPGLEVDALRAVAEAGGGRYHGISADDSDLSALMSAPRMLDLRGFEATDLASDRWRDDGIWLVLALLPLAALGFRRGLVFGLALTLAPLGEPRAFEWSDLWQRADQRGARLLEGGRAAEAAGEFVDDAWRGIAYYRAGHYELAADAFSGSKSADGHYNRGNALAHTGDLIRALESYDEALGLDPGHADARHNKAVLEKLLRSETAEGGSSRQRRRGQSAQRASEQERSEQRRGEESMTGEEGDSGGGSGESPEPSAQEQLGRGEEAYDSEYSQSEAGLPAETERQPEENDRGQAESSEGLDEDMGSSELSAGNMPPEGAGHPLSTEAKQALEQWLRRIPDDPGGLLRTKLALEHRRRQLAGELEHGGEPW